MIDTDDLWPRTEEYRFRLYARRPYDGRGEELDVLAAAPSMAGIGTAIGDLDNDHRAVGGSLNDEGIIGILDSLDGRWIVLPWRKGEKR